MENTSLKQLRYFEAVVQHAHFGRAAAACSISQPAISVQIKELETAVGQQLFQRHAKTIKLTTFGEVFAKKVRPILQAVDDLASLARSSLETLNGAVRLGIIPTVGPYLLPQIVKAVGDAFPDVDLQVRETQTRNLMSEMQVGNLDAALVALPIADTNLTVRPLLEECFVLVTSIKEKPATPISAETLRDMRLLLLEEGHCFRDQALSYCGESPSRSSDLMDGSSLATLVQLTASGLGATLIPEMAIALETRGADVAITTFSKEEPKRTIAMVWRQNSPLAHHLETLSVAIQASLSD